MRKFLFFITVIVVAVISFTHCNQGPTSTGPYSFDSIRFDPHPPKELTPNATPEQKVTFAWNEFLALNWRSSFYTDKKRDNPDPNWNYSSSAQPYPDLVVWETYLHRSELRPYSDQYVEFDNPPHYSFGAKPVPLPSTPNARFDLFDNLDENNEIGSCNLYGRVDVFDKSNQVLFQAKGNRDEYNYLLTYYPTKRRLLAATTRTVNNITTDSAYYPGAGLPCGCPILQTVVCLPCGGATGGNNGQPINGQPITGTMEVKTAWRRLAPDEDSTTFFTRNVIVYSKGPNNQVYYTNAIYALIGLHIIHKTQNYPNFVFATWEHVDVEKHHMAYIELDTAAGNEGNEIGPLHKDYPRLHPIPAIADSSTAYVHRELARKNPKSVWQYYRLVGVQTTPTNDQSSFSYFMANYVIESDSVLGNFHGSGIRTPFDGKANSLYQKHGYTMGGCQGCHGVAQTKFGGDQSFLMDTFGKPVDTPDVARSGGKLARLLRALDKINLQQQLLLKDKSVH